MEQLDERSITWPLPAKSGFVSNEISTSKYTPLTFIPRNLWEQFHKLANVYFLVIALLQVIPTITVSQGLPTIMLPLSVVLIITGAKDLFEDNKRRRSDQAENDSLVSKRENGEWVQEKWKNIKVGDVVMVSELEYFPADLLILRSSEESGICYIETKNLDGETNLKDKMVSKEIIENFNTDDFLDGLKGKIRYDMPNDKLYRFNAVWEIEGRAITLGYQQFLLRGCSLQNTSNVIGLVLYTGHETKVMLNSWAARPKSSGLEDKMQTEIMYIFLMQTIISLICATFYATWYANTENDTDLYLDLDEEHDNVLVQFIISYFSWILILSNLVPISLMVTLEMVKYIQSYFISNDLEIYDEAHMTPAEIHASNLNEELGQINYIFSDKTGTLTCNSMEFRKFSHYGTSYGTDEEIVVNKPENVNFVGDFDSRDPQFYNFLILLACCHTVVVQEKEGELIYRCSSPDELALVRAAEYFGVRYLGRDSRMNLRLQIFGEEAVFEYLHTLEFNSVRKRMSVIIKTPEGKVLLLCKGADTILEHRLAESNYKTATWEHVEQYAVEGLRTLVLAYKEIQPQDYEHWKQQWELAEGDIHYRQERFDELANSIETDLVLIGATGLEDKLQSRVPETISALKRAKIKLWLLTGDKIETAINVGFSCGLLTRDISQLVVNANSFTEARDLLQYGLLALRQDPMEKFGLIITGDALQQVLKPELLNSLITLVDRSEIVIACRVTPQQKADVVHLIRRMKPEVRTLAIGDGANDVNMILAAHVGIGISGIESRQASRASDFAITQFSFLQKLLFVHGRECYRRNSYVICYNFYKNALIEMPIVFYGIFSAFSAQHLYNIWTFQLYNFCFTSLPIVFYALFDREIEHEVLFNRPEAYSIGFKNKLFNTRTFWLWILEANLQAFVITLICLLAICYKTGDNDMGRMDSMYVASELIYFCVVLIANLKILQFSEMHFWFTWLLLSFFIGCYFIGGNIVTLWVPIEDFFANYNGYGSTWQMMKNPNSYLAMAIITVISFMFHPVISHARQLYKILDSTPIKEDLMAELTDDDEREELLRSELPPYSSHEPAFIRRHTGYAFTAQQNKNYDLYKCAIWGGLGLVGVEGV